MAAILSQLMEQWRQYCLRKWIVDSSKFFTILVIILAGEAVLWPTEFHWFIFSCQAIAFSILSIEWGRIHATDGQCLTVLYRQNSKLAEAIHTMLDFQSISTKSSGTAYFQAKYLDHLNKYLSKKEILKNKSWGFSLFSAGLAMVFLGVIIWFLPQLPANPLAQLSNTPAELNDKRTYRILFPAYTQKAILVYHQLPDKLQLPKGSRVEIIVNQKIISDRVQRDTIYEVNNDQKSLKWLSQKERWITSFSPLDTGILYLNWDNLSTKHEIEIIKDLSPEISVTWPQNKRIFSNSALSVTLVASDDYGLKKISLIYEVSKKGKSSEIIQSFEGQFTEHSETYPWELGLTFLRHGDEVVAWIEVEDNDTLDGPKISKSDKFSFTIQSIKLYHQDIITRIQNIVAEMGQLLSLLDRRLLSESYAKEQDILKELEMLQRDGRQDQLLTDELSNFLYMELREKILNYQARRLRITSKPS